MQVGIRETAAALAALGAYLTTALPAARKELRRWEPLPGEKARNAEAVAVLATLAPRSRRADVVRAIVALQVAIDRLDALEEEGLSEDARAADAGFLGRLEAEWRGRVVELPAGGRLLPLIERAVERCAEGQRRTHAAATGEVEGLRRWAESLDAPAGYRWWEVAAGASSSVAAHALIAAASDPAMTSEGATQIDAAYFPPIGALTVFLDDLVDREADRAAGEHNYLPYYDHPTEAAERLGLIAERAAALVDPLPQAPRHRAILAGVAAYYLSAEETRGGDAQRVQSRLVAALGPGARLLARFLQLRRLAPRKRPGQPG